MSQIEQFDAGFLHRPESPSGDALALTHGAGSNCGTALLVALANAFASEGVLVYRYDLPFRRRRSTGPPSPSTAPADQEGILAAVAYLRSQVTGRVLAGGHSYGGRQTTMAAATHPHAMDGLLLMSYPLHPPGKPAQLRTAHFPQLRAKALFVHGARDSFGSEEEMRAALPLIPSETDLHVVAGAGHDLGRKHAVLAEAIVSSVQNFLLKRP